MRILVCALLSSFLLYSCSTSEYHYTKKEIVLKCVSTEPVECNDVVIKK